MKNDIIKWGIIGCGDVTEVKSGPAFNKVDHSVLLAVMRRDAAKAADYAKRHGVPQWYADAEELLADPEMNAVYIATPPSSHEELTIKALYAGKDVYVEKPMAMTAASCVRMKTVAEETGRKLSVAHYRRFLPYFVKIRELIASGAIGEVSSITLKLMQGRDNQVVAQSAENWRLNPSISGGGLFYDLAPHQLDLMIYLFGRIQRASGVSVNQSEGSAVDDLVAGQLVFENNVLFNGFWSFNNSPSDNKDQCEIFGTKGKISFGFFSSSQIIVSTGGTEQVFEIGYPQHVQQPFIEQVVGYFLGKNGNPCPAEDGVEVLRIMDLFSKK